MIKKLFYLIILFSTITNQIQSYFTRGSIYNKDEQSIILLGDIHLANKDATINETQRKDLINSIQSFQDKDYLVLVEDGYSTNNYNKTDKKCLETIESAKEILKKMINNASINTLSPLFCLHSDIERKGIYSINIECRYAETAFSSGINISTEEIVNEFENNITKIEKHIEEIKKSNIENKQIILDFYKEEKQKIINTTKEYIEFLKEYGSSKTAYDISKLDLSKHTQQDIMLSKNPIIKEKMKIAQNIGRNLINMIPLVDINIAHNIVTNADKKTIIICAGLLHTSQMEDLLCKIGYKLTNENGISLQEVKEITKIKISETDLNIEDMTPDEINTRLTKTAKMFAELQKKDAINVNGLFDSIKSDQNNINKAVS